MNKTLQSTITALMSALVLTAADAQASPTGRPRTFDVPASAPQPTIDLRSGYLPRVSCPPGIARSFGLLGIAGGDNGVYRMGLAGSYTALMICPPGGLDTNFALAVAASSNSDTATKGVADLWQTYMRQGAGQTFLKPGTYPGRPLAMQLGTFEQAGMLVDVRAAATAALSANGLILVPVNLNFFQGEQQFVGGEAGAATVLVAIYTMSKGVGLGAMVQTQYVVVLATSPDSAQAEMLRNKVRAAIVNPPAQSPPNLH